MTRALFELGEDLMAEGVPDNIVIHSTGNFPEMTAQEFEILRDRLRSRGAAKVLEWVQVPSRNDS